MCGSGSSSRSSRRKRRGRARDWGFRRYTGSSSRAAGRYRWRANRGAGRHFRILLPAVEGARDAEPPAAVETGSARGSGTILLAEDEDGVRRFVGGVLRLNGYTVLEAGTGREALEVSRRHGRRNRSAGNGPGHAGDGGRGTGGPIRGGEAGCAGADDVGIRGPSALAGGGGRRCSRSRSLRERCWRA